MNIKVVIVGGVAGGGFIGLELAENLRELGLEVTIVQRPRQRLYRL